MNKQLAIEVRDAQCTACRLSAEADAVCVTGSGPLDADIMVVGKMPNSPTYQASLEADLAEAGIDPATVMFTSALKCRNLNVEAGTKTSIKACKTYLDAEIAVVKPKWVLALGNEALSSTTGNSGIMKYRGRPIARGEYAVFPTISPASVSRNPGQRPTYMADLKLFVAEMAGMADSIPKPKLFVIDTMPKLKKLKDLLSRAEYLSYDVETFSTPPGSEWAPNAKIVSLSGTMGVDGRQVVWALPLFHPESVWQKKWKAVLLFLKDELEKVPRQIAQNGKYDDRWLHQFGVHTLQTFDDMLAAHVLDENVSKGLKQQAAMRLGVRPWAIDTKELLTTPIKKVLTYNALDTYYTYHLYKELKRLLVEQPRVARIFRFILMPASQILTDVERRGVWIDRERLQTNHRIAIQTRAHLDEQIMEWVPDQSLWPTDSKGRPREVNFNASIFLRWLLFEHLKMPVVNRGKEKDDGSPGDPSVAEEVMQILRLEHPHPVIDLLMERSKWQKYCSAFLSAYEELLDENDRIHTTFKLYGTVTGRLSSGKSEADKITSRAPIRGVNLQQVPRDPFIRSLFGSAPGYTFVEADFSQVELRVVAFLSRDRTMLHLYSTGQDIHRATAAWVLGIPEDRVSKDDRKKAKAVNFGFVYGMGAPKFVKTAFEKYDVVFSLEEAQAIRKQFFEMYSGLLPWHARQRRLVGLHRRVQSPLGRIRHLPDIDSGDKFVRGEAERQAINSPVQSFASDMTMLAMIEIQRQFKQHNIDGHFISTVHDALLFEIRDVDVARALPIIKYTMENLWSLKKQFGVELDLPIVADLKVGRTWGEAKELTEEEVYNYEAQR
jgi:uracil-DNA glycosylase family 4